ncbi:MAG TPA: hypothetical protein VNM67_12700 [Thermoanaerobaculia bacterium]|nr:hypothetical protein [Thermoanaerobaculia bacterium]
MERLRRLARRLPGNGLAVVEIRLAREAAAIDLSLRVKEPGQALDLAQRVSPPHLQRFLSHWAEPGGPFAAAHSIWLEFDLDREPPEALMPVVCAKLFPDADRDWLIGSLLPSLHGKPLSEDQRQLVRFCHEAIPAPAYLLYVFSLLSRGGDAVRMEIFGLDPPGIIAYLKRVAPGAVPWIEGTADLFMGLERIHLSLDLGEDILPRIGIEGSFPGLPSREPRWWELFGRLVDRGLCCPDERNAALAWPGSESFWTAPTTWPTKAVGPHGFCFRKLSHVKVVCRPDRELEAKVYLLFGYIPERPAAES